MTEMKARRPKGTGHIVQRGTGFHAQWSSKDPATGQRRQHKKGPFPSERAARKYLTEQIGKVDAGTFIPAPQPMLVHELLDRWLSTKTECRPTTREGYAVAVESWLKPRIGGTKVQALTEQQVREALTELAERGGRRGGPLSERSCQLALIVLRQALSYAMHDGLAVRNVAQRVKVRPRRAPMKFWTAEQTRTFMAVAREDRHAALWALAVARGPRRGELVGLRLDQVDLAGKVARIVAARVLVGGHAVDSLPKTRAGIRSLPLDDRLVALIRAQLVRRAEDRLRAGTAWTETGYLFTDALGLPVRPEYVSDQFARLAARAGVPPIRFHDTRHTAATLMLAAGVPVKVVTEMLGHGDVRVTLSIYAHVMPGMAEEAGEALSALVL